MGTLRSFAQRSGAISIVPWSVATLVLAGWLAMAVAWEGEPDSSQGDLSPRFALLVGVDKYRHLGPKHELQGAVNDVRAVERMLLEHYDFREEQITTLVNEDATGDAIRRELDALVQKVRKLPPDSPPAEVLFHFSGHGSQLLDQRKGAGKFDEKDGWDETLVPYDAERQGGDQDIRDDKLYEFAQSICAEDRARLWVVLDCCHSGTGVRGATKIRNFSRGVGGEAPLRLAPGEFRERKLPPGAVALAACRAREVEREIAQGNEHYGLLTRFLVQVLSEAPAKSQLSYELLREAIINRYRQDPSVIRAPIPQLEGDTESLRRSVLGGGRDVAQTAYCQVSSMERDPSRVRLSRGMFHGVTVGSLYELYNSPEQAAARSRGSEGDATSPSLCWLRVVQVEGAGAVAQVIRWEDERQTEWFESVLPRTFKRGFAVERYHEHGDFGLRLRVVNAVDAETDGPPLSPGDESLPAVVRELPAFSNRPGESTWLTWVEGDESCHLILRIDGHYAALFPSTGMTEFPSPQRARARAVPASLRGGWGPIDLRNAEQARTELREYLRRITRARNLIRLASAQSDGPSAQHERASGSNRSPIRVDLELLSVEVDEEYAIRSQKPWPVDSERAEVMRHGDIYALRAVNRDTSGDPVYVTILMIEPNMGITALLPYQPGLGLADEQRLERDGDRISDACRCDGALGPRHAIVLATREPNDFCLLTQPELPTARGSFMRGGGSSLKELLFEQTYFRSRERAGRPRNLFDDTWSAKVIRWDAVP